MIFALDSELYFKLEQLNERKTKDGSILKETKSSVFLLMPLLFLLLILVLLLLLLLLFPGGKLHTC